MYESLSAVPPCIHRHKPVLLSGYLYIPGNWRMPSRCRILCESIIQWSLWSSWSIKSGSHLTAPSVVHLTTCFSSGSQHPGLSVKAWLPLSPLQRFRILNFLSLYYYALYLSRAIIKNSPRTCIVFLQIRNSNFLITPWLSRKMVV